MLGNLLLIIVILAGYISERAHRLSQIIVLLMNYNSPLIVLDSYFICKKTKIKNAKSKCKKQSRNTK